LSGDLSEKMVAQILSRLKRSGSVFLSHTVTFRLSPLKSMSLLISSISVDSPVYWHSYNQPLPRLNYMSSKHLVDDCTSLGC